MIRWIGTEARDALPGAQELWNRVLGSLVKPTEEEQQAIDRAETVRRELPDTPRPRESAASLPVMA